MGMVLLGSSIVFDLILAPAPTPPNNPYTHGGYAQNSSADNAALSGGPTSGDAGDGALSAMASRSRSLLQPGTDGDGSSHERRGSECRLSIVFAKSVSEGAPPRDTQPAEAPLQQFLCLPDCDGLCQGEGDRARHALCDDP